MCTCEALGCLDLGSTSLSAGERSQSCQAGRWMRSAERLPKDAATGGKGRNSATLMMLPEAASTDLAQGSKPVLASAC